MNPKLKKTLKVGTVIFAVVGLLAVVLVGVGFVMARSESKQDAAGQQEMQLLQSAYGGTITRFGVVVKRAEHQSGQVVLTQYLVQTLGHQTTADGKQELLVVGYRPLRGEISAKLENGEVDIAKMADAGSIDMLVSKADQRWSGAALLFTKKDKDWESTLWQTEIFNANPSDDGPQIAFPELTANTLSFSVVDSDGSVNYFTHTGKEFTAVLSTSTAIDDLDACLQYERDHPQPDPAPAAPAAAPAAAAPATPADGAAPAATEGDQASQPEGGSDNEEEVEEQPDFSCAKIQAALKVLPKMSGRFHEIEAMVEGEGRDHKHHKKLYVLWYSPNDKRYGFAYEHTGSGKTLNSDFMTDFLMSLNNPAGAK